MLGNPASGQGAGALAQLVPLLILAPERGFPDRWHCRTGPAAGVTGGGGGGGHRAEGGRGTRGARAAPVARRGAGPPRGRAGVRARA